MMTTFILAMFLNMNMATAAFNSKPECDEIKQVYTMLEGFELKFSKYVAFENNTKAVLILPPTGGRNILDTGYAKLLCSKGLDTFILEGWTGDDEYAEDFGVHQRILVNSTNAITQMLNFLNYDKLGLIGTSAGGITANAALSLPENLGKVDAYLTIATGSPLCSTIALAGEEVLKAVREKRMKEYGIGSVEEYEKLICNAIDFRISKQRPYGLKFGMILAQNDTVVLTQYQKSLRDNWAPDLYIEMKGEHTSVIAKAFLFKRSKIKDFFIKELK